MDIEFTQTTSEKKKKKKKTAEKPLQKYYAFSDLFIQLKMFIY